MSDERRIGVNYSSVDSFVSSFDERAATLAVRSAGGLQPREPVALDVRLRGGGHLAVRGVVGEPRSDGRRGVKVRLDPAAVGRVRKAAAGVRGGALPDRDDRYDVGDLPVRCHRDGRVFIGTLRDVSGGGCCLALRSEPPSTGTHLALEFAPAGRTRARPHVEGAVTWIEPEGSRSRIGIRFGPGQDNAVRRFLFAVLLAD